MATAQRSTKTPKWANKEATPGVKLEAGPYIGVVKNSRDPARSGRLQVFVPDFGGQAEDDPSNWKTVGYASPYYGHTHQPSQNNPSDSANNVLQVEHTYGMWMAVPDVGSLVLCTFVGGDPDRGYWFACINENLSHNMLPAVGRAVGNNTIAPTAPDVANAYDDTSNLPVAEFNQQITSLWSGAYINNPMPVHDYQASTYLIQGLDRDLVRGAISSSSQREAPTSVFGISTPGRPLVDDTSGDYEAYQASLTDPNNPYVPPTSIPARKGGHTFVMDDGDAGGIDQLIRLRTSAGHQVLMNDTEGIIYIANSTGTSWIEMNAVGQIQIYSAAGVAVRTQGPLDLHSDADVNIQGQNVNINALQDITATAQNITASAAENATVLSTTALVSGTGTTTITGATTNISGPSQVNVAGGTVNLNCGGPVSPTAPTPATPNSFSDTTFQSGKSRWEIQADALESIVTVAPTHEPYARNASTNATGKVILDVLDSGALGATQSLDALSAVANSIGLGTAGNGS